MKVLFLICYATLDSELAYSVSQQLLSRQRGCEVIAFLIRPEDFEHDYHYLLERLNKADISLASAKDYPKSGAVKILQGIKPDVLITTDDVSPLQHKFLIASKFLGIPSLLVQPGITNEIPFTARSYFDLVIYGFSKFRNIFNDYKHIWTTLSQTQHNIFQRIRYIFKDLAARLQRKKTTSIHGICLKIAVSGDFNKELLIRQGISSDKMVVTGLPRLDSIYTQNREKDAFIQRLESQKDRQIVLFLPDASDIHQFISTKTYRQTIYDTINSCRQLPEVQLVIKPHPYEDHEIYGSILEKLDYDALIYKGSNLHDLIRASDVVITGISTTGLETLILNKPLIIVCAKSEYFPSDWEYIPYISSGVAFGVNNMEDLPRTITTALYNSQERDKLTANRAKFLYNHIYLQDGKASQRVADLILEMGK